MKYSDQHILNPWFSIWRKPRATMQYIIDHDSQKWILLLSMLYGVSNFLDRASYKNLGDHFSLVQILLLTIVLGPIFGILTIHIGSLLVRWTGQWLGGAGHLQQIKASLAWSTVPLTWVLPLWCVELVIFGKELFTEDMPVVQSSLALLGIFLFITLIQMVAAIWSFIVLLKCISQVQGFSTWKALGNIILASLVVILPLLLIIFAVISFIH